MIQLDPASGSPDHPDGVESIGIYGVPVTGDPGPCDGGDLAALVGGYGIEGVPEGPCGSGFDLDECDGIAAPRDEIDLLVTEPEIAFDDGPSMPLERICGEGFCVASKLVSPVHADMMNEAAGRWNSAMG